MTNSKIYILVFFILFAVKDIQSQAETIKVSKEINTSVETLVNALIQQSKVPGISIAVSKYSNVIYARGFGYANVKENIKMTAETQLRTASVAKVITATAIGRLLSEDKLDLDAPIKIYIPYIDQQYENLTSRQLAAHTSGLEHRPKGNSYKKKQYNSIQETVELMDTPLLFVPDSDYKYSTHAFNLLAAVIEGASGTSYLDYLNQEIFKPLYMEQTFAENIKKLTDKDAQLYYIKNGKLKVDDLTNASYKIPGAGFRSTPTDLVNMMNAYSNGLISNKTANEMFKSHKLNNGEGLNVGVAWRSSIDPFGLKVIEHAGSWVGARTVVVHYPEEQLSISIMINASYHLLIEETAHMIAHLFLNTQAEDSSIAIKKQDIELTFFGKKKKEYKGQFSFDGKKGILETKSDSFLESNPIFYLGSTNDYALVTRFGLLYLNLDLKSETVGKLFIYNNRLSENPRELHPISTFKLLEE